MNPDLTAGLVGISKWYLLDELERGEHRVNQYGMGAWRDRR